jgi:twitching motility protein PilT
MNPATSHLRLIDALHVARQHNASDIHLVPGLPPAIRVDGELRFLAGSPLTAYENMDIARSLFDDAAIEQIQAGEDASVTRSGDDRLLLRVHGYWASEGCTLAVRLLNKRIPSLESLHLPPIVSSLSAKERGLVIFSGPTGSGKSTSLAALIGEINASSPRRIITIEDPIEYRHESARALITQREVGKDASSFASALVGALRSDPDVIMVGEMRETLTMKAALSAAETGHLVLTTLHTGDAVQTIDRVIDAFSGSEQSAIRSQLAQTLTAIVAQRLLPRAQGVGRRAAVEILLVTDAVRSMIRESRTHLIHNVITTGRSMGMQTFEHHLSELVAHNEIGRDHLSPLAIA